VNFTGAHSAAADLRNWAWLALAGLSCGLPARAQSVPAPAPPDVQNAQTQDAHIATPPVAEAAGIQLDQQPAGSVHGTVVYADGSVVVGAQITLRQSNPTATLQALSDTDGQFSFPAVAPGPFQLQVAADAFTSQTVSGTLRPGEAYAAPPVTLVLAPNVSSVQVVATTAEIAQAEIHMEETQRLFGVIPNFYVSYVPDAAPLNPKQKFQLAWKTTIDPITFGLVGAIAGVEQANNTFREYGQGAQGYGRRFGAAYADTVTGNFIGGAILPSLLRQDPRYFYKGTGTVRSRLLYALAAAVICKGDNRRWQPNYSSILGGIAAGGISDLYYPTQNRNGATLVFENTLIGIGAGAAANILQEFVVRKATPNLPRFKPGKS
jgi:hypothetical protein